MRVAFGRDRPGRRQSLQTPKNRKFQEVNASGDLIHIVPALVTRVRNEHMHVVK